MSELLKYNPESVENKVEDNRDLYHQIIGGKRIYWDLRYCFKHNAPKARELLIDLKKDRGINFGDISKEIGISSSTISRVARGTAGLIPKKEYNGLSTTEYVVIKLESIVNEKENN